MTLYPDAVDAVSALDPQWSPAPRTGFVENLVAAGRGQYRVWQSNSRSINLADAYRPLVAQLNEGAAEPVANPYDPRGMAARALKSPEELEGEVWAKIAERRLARPDFALAIAESREDLHDKARARAVEAGRDAAETLGRATTAGEIGAFVGEMGVSLSDPLNVATAFFGAPWATSVVKFALVEGLIGAATEAGIQIDAARYQRELGFDYDMTDFARNVALGGAGGFVLGGALLGGARGAGAGGRALERRFAKARHVGRLLDELVEGADPRDVLVGIERLSRRQALEAFEDLAAGGGATSEQAAARDILDRIRDAETVQPTEDTPAGRQEHLVRLEAAEAAARAGRLADLPDRPAAAPGGLAVEETEAAGGGIEAFDPETLAVDAELFQFKAGGDGAGVTDRLAGVERWDPVKAGLVLVYEFADGRRFIADGHQRLGLARRIAAADPDQRVVLYGHVLREADGFPPEFARVVAASKNIAEGTGSAIDAAKVLRVAPDQARDLPPRSALVRQARDLVALGDRAFGMVVNEIVPPPHAALVGRLAPLAPGGGGEALQMAILDLLARLEPANAVQAESIVRQALSAGARREVQETLFGTEETAVLAFSERAKILDAAMRRLRRDKTVFSTLTDERGRIEAEGNRLAVDENRRRAETDAQAIQIVQTLAHRRGAVADALDAAAKSVLDGGRRADAVAGFADAVRDAIARGDLAGLDSGRGLGPGDAAPEGGGGAPDAGGRAPEAEAGDLEPFAEPAGRGQENQADSLERATLADLADVVGDPAAFRHPETGETLPEALARAQTLPPTAAIDTPERQALRARIAADLYGAGAARKERFVDLVLGPPAAGKSGLAEPLAARRRALLIDADAAKERLPEFEGGIGAGAVHEESVGIVEGGAVLGRALRAGDNIVWPMVGRTLANIEARIALLRAAGYRVRLHLVELPAEKAVQRAVERFSLQGRLVSPKYVLDVGDAPSQNFDVLIQRGDLDGWTHYSNDVERGAPPALVRSSDPGSGPGAGSGQDLGRDLPPDAARGGGRNEGRSSREGGRSEEARPGLTPAGRGAPDDPTLKTEKTAAGDQTVVPGAERISDRELAERRMAGRSRPTADQRPADEGLFDVADRGQGDLLDAVPVGERIDENGGRAAEALTRREILDEIEGDRDFVEQLGLCGT